MKIIVIFFTLLLIALSLIGYSYVSGGCVTNIEFAKSKVRRHLTNTEMPRGKLDYAPTYSSECTVAFTYKNKGNTIYFSVIDGGKVTWWDVSERGPLNGR